MNRNLLLSSEEQQNALPAFDEHILFSLERRYLDMVDVERLELAMNPVQDSYNYQSHLRMIRIEEVYHKGETTQGLHVLNMQNILSALKDDSHSVVNVIRSDGHRTSSYYGLSRRIGHSSSVSTHEYSRMLRQTMHGNFLGVRMTPLSADQAFEEVIAPVLEQQTVMAFPGIPSLRLKDQNGPYVQGMDRFMEGMRGEKYVLVIIAEPIGVPDIDGMIKNLFDLSTSVHSLVKSTVQKMKGSSDTVNVGMFGMMGSNEATTTSESTTDSETSLALGSILTAAGTALGAAYAGMQTGAVAGAAAGMVAPGPGNIAGATIGAAIGGLIGTFAAVSSGLPISKTSSFTRSIAHTVGQMSGKGFSAGYARGWNRSTSVSQEVLNKTAEYCEKLCDNYITRLQSGKNLGFWNVGVYLLSKSRYTQLRGQGLLRSALSGDETHWEPIRSVSVNNEALGQYVINFNNPKYNLFLHGEQKQQVEQSVSLGAKLREYAERFGKSAVDILQMYHKADEKTKTTLLEAIRRQPGQYTSDEVKQAWSEVGGLNLGHPLGPAMGGVSTPMNTEELSIIMNVPREEVQGITIRESTPFGINYPSNGRQAEDVLLGHIVHKREVLEDAPWGIPQDQLKKHGFVCGVTGSGKTNTCMSLLRKLNKPFLVLEPAKSEYRQLLSVMPDLKIFTLGNETISPFRINPFEFIPGTQLLTHIDSLKAVFNASFPMYASMPYLLEEALVEVYLDKGWELATSTNRYFNVQNYQDFHNYLPTLEDLLQKIDKVVDSKKYAQQLSMDLSAALKARLSSLLTGSKGLMLNTRRSTPLGDLLNEKVVLELKYIGDDDEKCFLMGLIFSMIYEYREANHIPSQELRHLILIEEAHRLLRRVPESVSMESANARGKAVETFTNIISEIREYGEGVIVADQIPTKLTPDIIKNTSLKIVHRTLAKDDREFVGDTMTLTEEQSRELPLLRVGQAVIHREGLDKPFLVQIADTKDQVSFSITNEHIRKEMDSFHQEHKNVFRRLPGFEKSDLIPSLYNRMDFRRFNLAFYESVIAVATAFAVDPTAENALRPSVKDIFIREVISDDPLDHACVFIGYANRLFQNINETYPGRYNECLTAHQMLIDLWFGSAQDPMTSSTIDAYRRSMSKIVSGDVPYRPMLRWYIERSEAVVKLRETLQGETQWENYKRLDSFLSARVTDLLLGAGVPPEAMSELKTSMLRFILQGNPSKETILENYNYFVKGS